MKLLSLALLIIGSSALAGTNGYDLKMDLSLNGKHVSSPRVLVKAGETATVTQKNGTEETFIEVVATEGQIQNHKGILINMIVGTINQNGQRTIVSKPQILAKENQPALMSVGDKNGEEISLSVLATRKDVK